MFNQATAATELRDTPMNAKVDTKLRRLPELGGRPIVIPNEKNDPPKRAHAHNPYKGYPLFNAKAVCGVLIL